MALSYWEKFALLAAGVIGVGYIAKKANASPSSAVHAVDKLKTGDWFTADLSSGYVADPTVALVTMGNTPPKTPNVPLQATVLELGAGGQIVKVHAMYSAGGSKFLLSIDPSQVTKYIGPQGP
jgi:hypothetical protein